MEHKKQNSETQSVPGHTWHTLNTSLCACINVLEHTTTGNMKQLMLIFPIHSHLLQRTYQDIIKYQIIRGMATGFPVTYR